MTCIVALKYDGKVFMAGDRGASDTSIILPMETPKIHKSGPFLIGFSGSMSGQRLEYNFKPSVPNTKNIDEYMHTTFLKELRAFYEEWWIDMSSDGDLELLIGIKGEIFEHCSVDMSMNKSASEYIASGSGSEYAYGYFKATENRKDARARVIGAVTAATTFSTTCMLPVDFLAV